MPKDSNSCTVFILTYKGKPYLETLLPTVKAALNFSGNISIETIVVDNAQSKKTQKFVEENYPEFKYFYAPQNDFLFSYNPLVRETKSEFVFLLNDDIKLADNFFLETLPLIMNDKMLFAVSATLYDWEGTYIQEGVRTISLKNGWMKHHHEASVDDKIRYTFNACGGASVYRTQMFNDLLGFDRQLFYPAYYEDSDLSHRAWHKGWKIINNPRARVFHKGGGSWSENNKNKKVDILRESNKMIGMLKNCDTPWFATQFFLYFPIRFIKSLVNKYTHPFSYFNLLLKLPAILISRFTAKNSFKDNQLIELLGKEYVCGAK